MTNDVITAVLKVYDISLNELIGKSRKRYVVEARKMATLFLVNKMRQVDIAELLNFDRSNVVYNVRTIKDEISLYTIVRHRYENIYKILAPQGALEILKQKRSQLEKTLVNNHTATADFRFAQIQELERINNKISNILKQKV